MKKIYTMLGIILLVGLLVLAGCSDNQRESEEVNNSNISSSTEDTLIYAQGHDAVTLDPGKSNDSDSKPIINQIYEPLIAFNEDMEMVPVLAKEWDMSEDGLAYTFQLREGVKFHDGEEFNADAVVYNFERWMEGDESFIEFGSVFGFNTDDDYAIENVEAVDEYTVEFNLTRPMVGFLNNLTVPSARIGSPKAIKEHGDEFSKYPVGTGPFKLAEWDRNSKIVLEKFEDYWEEGYPKLNQVIFTFIGENTDRLTALKTGEIDLMVDVDPSAIEEVKNNDDLQFISQPQINISYMGLTVNREPLDNKKLRQAMHHAINKEDIVKNFYSEGAKPAESVIPPNGDDWVSDEVITYDYNPEKAKKLVDESGLSDDAEIEFWIPTTSRSSTPNPKKTAEAIQSDLSKVGINIVIRESEIATFLDKGNQGETDAHLTGWENPNATPNGMLSMVFTENSFSYYDNDEFYELVSEAKQTPNIEESNKLFTKALQIGMEDTPIIPIAHTTRSFAGKPNIEGFNPHPPKEMALKTVYFK